MLGIIKFELNIKVKQIISRIIRKKSIKHNGYYEFIGNTKLVNKYGIEKCGAVYMNGSIYIIWDETFYESITTETRLFCRLHELGHFTGVQSLTQILSHERRLDEEVRADSYAVKRMGYENAMTSMKELLNYFNDYQQAEMNQRISMQKMMYDTKMMVKKFSMK